MHLEGVGGYLPWLGEAGLAELVDAGEDEWTNVGFAEVVASGSRERVVGGECFQESRDGKNDARGKCRGIDVD